MLTSASPSEYEAMLLTHVLSFMNPLYIKLPNHHIVKQFQVHITVCIVVGKTFSSTV